MLIIDILIDTTFSFLVLLSNVSCLEFDCHRYHQLAPVSVSSILIVDIAVRSIETYCCLGVVCVVYTHLTCTVVYARPSETFVRWF